MMKREAQVKEKLEVIRELKTVTLYNPKKPAMPYITTKKDIVRGIEKALEWVLRDDPV